MPTNNCGCITSGDSCYSGNQPVKQVLYPVMPNNCTGNGSSSSIEGCPTYFEPSTLTGTGPVTIPAVGATFNITVCDASKFRIGMWVTNPALGRYPIVGINAATNLLTLQNSCDDGETAIVGNPDPGTQITGSLSLWLAGESPCLDAEAQQQAVYDALIAIDEDNQVCLPNMPLTADAECVYLLGLSAACDSGDCPAPDDPNCLKKLDGVRFCRDSIVFEDMAIATEEECVRPAVITENGNLKQAPSGAGMVKPTKVYLGSWGGEFTDGPGLAAALTFQIDLGNYGVPECAVGCFIRLIYAYDFNLTEGNGAAFTTYLRATGQPSQNTAYKINGVNNVEEGSTLLDRETTDALGGVSVVFGADKVIYHEFKDDGTVGDDNKVSVQLYLDAIIL